MIKIIKYSMVGLLAVAMVGGMAYVLVNQSQDHGQSGAISGGQARAGAWSQNNSEVRSATTADSQGRGRSGGTSDATGGYRGGQATTDLTVSKTSTTDRGRGGSGSSGGASGRNQTDASQDIVWEIVTGTVVAADEELAVQTAEGEVVIGLGQASYREGFTLKEGDIVSVTGFYEDGEFKAGTISNMSTGETLTLRDESGRPMWSGGRRYTS